MQDLNDSALLREYAERNSEEAFATLVTRHVNKVYSIALRHTRNPHTAEEITQAVFVILARKCRGLGKGVIISGWLYQTARLTAVTHIRSEIRRAHRNQEAHMQTILNENKSDVWTQIEPLLDAAIVGLSEKDRHAVVLRFFDGKSLREVGAALGANEDTARMRVNRALERLRLFFKKRGVSSTTAIIAGAVSANSVQAAPEALAKSVTAIALAHGATASSSTLTLIKGALKIMAWTKAKTAILTGVAIILATGTTTLIVNKSMALSVTDLSWADDPKYWTLDLGNPDPQKRSNKDFTARIDAFNKRINKLPPVLIIRPTKFRTNPGEINYNGRIIGRMRTFSDLLKDAYDPQMRCRLVLPADFPKQSFDIMLTLPDNPGAALQEALKSKFGYVAHVERIETNALLLKVKTPAGPALQPTKGGLPSYPTRSPQNKITIKNQQTDGIAACFGALLHTLVIDQTDIKGRYDIALQWETRGTETPEEAFQRTVLEELGLEFVPSHQSKNYLIVEKTK